MLCRPSIRLFCVVLRVTANPQISCGHLCRLVQACTSIKSFKLACETGPCSLHARGTSATAAQTPRRSNHHCIIPLSFVLLEIHVVKFATMDWQVSSISGDARRVLDICWPLHRHRTLYICVHLFLQRTIGCRRRVELVQPFSLIARTDGPKDVIRNPQNSPTTRVPTLALATRANPPRCTAQMRPSYRRVRDPVGGQRTVAART